MYQHHCLALQPQDSIPDVMVWMLVEGKRVACHRIPAQHLMYADTAMNRGKYCGKIQTVTLKVKYIGLYTAYTHH